MDEKKKLIYDCAKQLFAEKGFKDTNVSEITRQAGVAVGTFYLNFASKEKLFFVIFMEENLLLKQYCLDNLDYSASPQVIVEQMLRLNAEGIRANPILRQWYQSGVYHKLEQVYREEHAMGSMTFLYDAFLVLVERWQTEGKMRRDIDSRMIMMIFAAIVNVDTHKDEIGMEFFPELLHVMTALVMQGLTEHC
ncbi:MAG: helix-turn-helix domain-containing protein [Clostridiaceae bacterium]